MGELALNHGVQGLLDTKLYVCTSSMVENLLDDLSICQPVLKDMVDLQVKK